MALYSYGVYSHGLYSYRMCSHGLFSYGVYSYGLHSYGLYSYGLYMYGLYNYGPYTYGRRGQDITARKGMENELKLVAVGMPRKVAILSRCVNEWNQTAVRITKYSRGEVMGKDLVKTYITEEFRAPVNKVP